MHSDVNVRNSYASSQPILPKMMMTKRDSHIGFRSDCMLLFLEYLIYLKCLKTFNSFNIFTNYNVIMQGINFNQRPTS